MYCCCLLHEALAEGDHDEAERDQRHEERDPVAEVLHDGADEGHGDEAGKLQAEPHEGHQRRPLLRLRAHLLRILGLGQQVAGGQLELHQEEAHDQAPDAHVVVRHHADRGARADAEERRDEHVRRLVVAADGQVVANEADDRLHGPGQLRHAAEDLHLGAGHLVGPVEVLHAGTGEGRGEALHVIIIYD